MAGSLQHERDAALDEVRRQEALREHFVVVLDRATASGESITPEALLSLAADTGLLGHFGDARMQSALQLALSDLFLQHGDYPRALTLLDELEPSLSDDRAITLAALNRAEAAIRSGQMGMAGEALERANQHMTQEQRDAGHVLASYDMIRGQWLRARGDLAGAEQSARDAVHAALKARDGSPLARGILVGSGASAMLMAGDLDTAIQWADQAEAIWRDAGVSHNVFANTVASQRATALFLHGDILAAQTTLQALENTTLSESIPARVARDATMAKVLALLDQPESALLKIDAAVARMCQTTGEQSLDCLRMQLSRIDTRLLCQRLDLAAEGITRLTPQLVPFPPLQAALATQAKMLAVLQAPHAVSRQNDLIEALTANAQSGVLARLSAVRNLLLLAEALQRDDEQEGALRLSNAALEMAGQWPFSGMDAALLEKWRARQAGAPPSADAREQLRRALGDTHPLLQQY